MSSLHYHTLLIDAGTEYNKFKMLAPLPLNKNKSGTQPTPASEAIANIRSRVVRTPFYLISMVLLFIATILILIALFTNNWQKTASFLVSNSKLEYFTYGLWFTCRHVNADWLTKHSDDVYCHTTDYSKSKL